MVNGKGICNGRMPTVRRARCTIENNERRDKFKYKPSVGGRGYHIDIRRQAVSLFLRGELNQQALLHHLRSDGYFPSKRTWYRWLARVRAYHHIKRYKATGNKTPTVLQGFPKVLLALYRAIYPKCSAAEINTFLWNSNGRFQNPPRIYHLAS